MCAYMPTYMYISAKFKVDREVASWNRYVWKIPNSDSSDSYKFHSLLKASEEDCYAGVDRSFPVRSCHFKNSSSTLGGYQWYQQ